MIQLIKENRFPELIESLKNPNDFQMHDFLLEVLLNNKIEIKIESFDASRYQEEFIEGLEIYLALEKSNINELQLKEYTNVLVELAFNMSGLIQFMSKKAMDKGAYLSDMNDLYEVKPEIREKLQVFIDVLKTKNDEDKAIANVAAAKAQVSNSIGNLLEKFEIGDDMLQFAQSYEQVGQTEFAIKIYQGIMNDFECESVKNSSGLLPEIAQIDTRPKREIEIFEKAKEYLELLTGEKIPEIKRVHIDDDIHAKKLVEESENQNAQVKEDLDELEKVQNKQINRNLYEKIVAASRLLLKKEYDKNVNIIWALDCLGGIVENEDLNEVSDIYIFEERIAESEVKLKNTILHAITSIIGFEYKEEHFNYLENIILIDKESKGVIALDYILKLGRYHENFKDRVLSFVEENILTFSRKQLSIITWYLVNLYPEDSRNINIIKAVENKAGVRILDKSKETVIEKKVETPITEKPEEPVIEKNQDTEINADVVNEENLSETKAWWKFW